MTKDEALKLALKFVEDSECGTADLEAHIKEALAQPEQEPLEYWNAVEGWVRIDEVREHFDSVGCGTIYKTAGEGREPLYTTPPQRTWVGLTGEEIEASKPTRSNDAVVWELAVEWAEAKLKEKNT
jgi:hypothetical protein